MNKNYKYRFIGWSLIILSTVSLLIMLYAAFMLTPLCIALFEDGSNNFILLVFIVIYLSIFIAIVFLFRFGLAQITKANQIEIIPYHGTLEINFRAQINFIDYRNYLVIQRFKTPLYIIIFCVLIMITIYNFNNWEKPIDLEYFYLSLLIYLIIGPLTTLFAAYKQLKTNSYLKQVFDYKITNEGISMISENVNSTGDWSNFYKIKETKKLFVLCSGEGIATFLEKRHFKETEIIEFQKFLNSLPLKR